MKISKEEISSVIHRVLLYYMKKKEIPEDSDKILFMVPGYPIAPEELVAEYELYDELKHVEFFLEEACPSICASDTAGILYKGRKEDEKKVFAAIGRYKRLEIYAPAIDFLRNLREGREEDIFVKAALCFLMTKKTVKVRLPYDPMELPEGRFAKQIRDLAADLWDMGICFTGLVPEFGSLVSEAGEPDSLITEEKVETYYERGYRELVVRKGAVVTPLALERAKERNVHIITT